MDNTLFAQAYALQGDERTVFMTAHNIDHVEFWRYTQSLKRVDRRSRSVKQLAKRHKRNLLAVQRGECVLCEEPIPDGCNLFLVPDTDSVICQKCHLGLALLRKWAGCGVTAERVATLVPKFFATAPGPGPVQPPRPAQPSVEPDLGMIDPFDPYAP